MTSRTSTTDSLASRRASASADNEHYAAQAAAATRLLSPLTSRAAREDQNAAAAMRQQIHALRGLQELLATEIDRLEHAGAAASQDSGSNRLWPAVGTAGHLAEQLATALGYEGR